MKNYELIPAGEVMARLLKKEEIFAVDLAVLVENYEENKSFITNYRLCKLPLMEIQCKIENEDMLFFKKVGVA